MNLVEDSTGFKFRGDGEWQARKFGIQGRRQWRRGHLAIETQPLPTSARWNLPSREGDSPVLPDLLDQIPDGEDIGTVTADVARRCHRAIIAGSGTTIFPIRKNGRPCQ